MCFSTKQQLQRQNPKRKRPICAHCGVLGHLKDKCFKLHGYPPTYFKKGQQSSASNAHNSVHHVSDPALATTSVDNPSTQQYQMMMDFIQAQMAKAATPKLDHTGTFCIGKVYNTYKNVETLDSCTWIFDSGASSHICCDLSLFNSFTYVHNRHVTLPNKATIPGLAIGSLSLTPKLQLNNVFYIPTFSVNLVSVSKLLQDTQISLTFFSKHFVIQEINLLKKIGRGIQINDLYFLHTNTLYTTCKVFDNSHLLCHSSPSIHTTNNANIWQYRFGHLSDSILKILSIKVPFHMSSNFNSHTCTICPLAKQKILTFVSHNHFAQNPFDLIHCDI